MSIQSYPQIPIANSPLSILLEDNNTIFSAENQYILKLNNVQVSTAYGTNFNLIFFVDFVPTITGSLSLTVEGQNYLYSSIIVIV